MFHCIEALVFKWKKIFVAGRTVDTPGRLPLFVGCVRYIPSDPISHGLIWILKPRRLSCIDVVMCPLL